MKVHLSTTRACVYGTYQIRIKNGFNRIFHFKSIEMINIKFHNIRDILISWIQIRIRDPISLCSEQIPTGHLKRPDGSETLKWSVDVRFLVKQNVLAGTFRTDHVIYNSFITKKEKMFNIHFRNTQVLCCFEEWDW